ncbi:segregation/condensation protein A [Leptolyngbya sp. FACHB-261]|uniref:segregation/condensation protein A n=1 Tax=Leptolyngbya sp. FACHB-261 TaxID=2692806 RepID=UPI00168280C3|nr:ScpA family protein [Leptolyngbya sp. FACHB-261]MBD2104906.1 segregation/condensation protein A [Leptolyngbya sp. FACHB-261]
MADSLAQDAISLLIDLAERGEINPWDVHVIDVIDRFLTELAPKNQQDLYKSGQALLYASTLILLKAQTLAQMETQQESSDEPEELLELLDAVALGNGLPYPLEHQLRRRPAALPPTARPITLQELITQLEIMASSLEQSGPSRPKRGLPNNGRTSRTKALQAIAQLAHRENLSEVVEELEHFLVNHWSTVVPQAEGWLDLDRLLEFYNDRVGVFWALLLLSARSRVELSQDEFYIDLKLRPLDLSGDS